MPSFDIVSKIDMPSVQNGLDGVKKEISTRYDFKGSMCEVEQQEDKIIICLLYTSPSPRDCT